jgi:DNA-binding response OmpR family regulator
VGCYKDSAETTPTDQEEGSTAVVNVLLVEDDPRIVRFVKRGLEAEGYSVEVVGNGDAALELSRGNQYAIVILDRLLPGLDGMEVCQTLRREKRQCMVLMLTAKDTLQDRVEGLQGGADDYLTKPFAFDELLARMEALLRRRPNVCFRWATSRWIPPRAKRVAGIARSPSPSKSSRCWPT